MSISVTLCVVHAQPICRNPVVCRSRTTVLQKFGRVSIAHNRFSISWLIMTNRRLPWARVRGSRTTAWYHKVYIPLYRDGVSPAHECPVYSCTYGWYCIKCCYPFHIESLNIL